MTVSDDGIGRISGLVRHLRVKDLSGDGFVALDRHDEMNVRGTVGMSIHQLEKFSRGTVTGDLKKSIR